MTRSAFGALLTSSMTLAVALLLTAAPAAGQPPPPEPQAPAPQQPAEQPDASEEAPQRADPDARIDPLQPDFSLAALPTTLRMPRHKWSFRITHRFTRAIDDGDVGDFFSDLFGFDSAATVGLELRFGLFRGTQVGVHRTSDRTIEIFGQHNFLNERDGAPIGFDALLALEGVSNMKDGHQAVFGVIASKQFARRIAVYVEPIVLTNSNPSGNTDDTTLMLGLGGRLRVLRSVYLLGEITPRLTGQDSGADQVSFGLEMRPGGHLFQINVSNGWGTTLGQLARGGFTNDRWYLGFNISRKFF